MLRHEKDDQDFIESDLFLLFIYAVIQLNFY